MRSVAQEVGFKLINFKQQKDDEKQISKTIASDSTQTLFLSESNFSFSWLAILRFDSYSFSRFLLQIFVLCSQSSYTLASNELSICFYSASSCLFQLTESSKSAMTHTPNPNPLSPFSYSNFQVSFPFLTFPERI